MRPLNGRCLDGLTCMLNTNLSDHPRRGKSYEQLQPVNAEKKLHYSSRVRRRWYAILFILLSFLLCGVRAQSRWLMLFACWNRIDLNIHCEECVWMEMVDGTGFSLSLESIVVIDSLSLSSRTRTHRHIRLLFCLPVGTYTFLFKNSIYHFISIWYAYECELIARCSSVHIVVGISFALILFILIFSVQFLSPSLFSKFILFLLVDTAISIRLHLRRYCPYYIVLEHQWNSFRTINYSFVFLCFSSLSPAGSNANRNVFFAPTHFCAIAMCPVVYAELYHCHPSSWWRLK